MLTIREVHQSGLEILFQVHNIVVNPTPDGYTLTCETENGNQTLESGTVYVMNDNGKTVSVYRMGEKTIEGGVIPQTNEPLPTGKIEVK